MAKKKSVKRTAVRAPTSVGELREFVRYVGINKRKLDAIQTKLNEKIEQLKAQAIVNSLPHQEEIDRLFDGIYIFAESHRDELTEKGKKKTVNLPTGDILWRLTPPAVSLKNVKRIIELCKSCRLKRFIRTKEEVDKEAMLKEPERAKEIKGVTISQKEEFVVKPSEIEIEISKDTKKLKKALN